MQRVRSGPVEARLSRSWIILAIAASLSPDASLALCGRTVWGELFNNDPASKPYSAPYIVLAVADSSEWRPAAQSALGTDSALFNRDSGDGKALFLRFRPILPIRGPAPTTPFWADAAFVHYANGMCIDTGNAIHVSVGDTVATAATEKEFLSDCSTIIVEAGLLGGKPVMEVIKAYQEREKDRDH